MKIVQWKTSLLLLLFCGVNTGSVFGINAEKPFSGDGSGSGSDSAAQSGQDTSSATRETILHEITATVPTEYEQSLERSSAHTEPSCIQAGNCGMTESPIPTMVLDLDLDEAYDTVVEAKETAPCQNDDVIRIRLDEIEKKQKEQGDKNNEYFLLIMEKLSLLEKKDFVGEVARIFEQNIDIRFANLEKRFDVITKASDQNDDLPAQKKNSRNKYPIKPPTPASDEFLELVATDTWSYIDSKFSELNAKLLDANERRSKDLEEKMNLVLQKYDREDENQTTKSSSDEDESKKDPGTTQVMVCKQCCKEVPLSVFTAFQRHQSTGITERRRFGAISYVPVMEKEYKDMPMFAFAREIRRPWTTAAGLRTDDADVTAIATGGSATPAPPTVKKESNQESKDDPTNNFRNASALDVLERSYFQSPRTAMNATINSESPATKLSKVKRKLPEESVAQKSHRPNKTFSTTLSPEAIRFIPKPSKRKYPMHCADIYRRGSRTSGIYRISLIRGSSWKVFCDMDTDGGGWTVIQRRTLGNVNFTRGWKDYKNGFGSVNGDFWLGLEKMHIFTGVERHKAPLSLRIDLTDWSDVSQYAQYRAFRVGSEVHGYKLMVKQYFGTAGNALQYGDTYNHNHRRFTTFDRDNDGYNRGNCGSYYASGWWFNACFAANLNGIYYGGSYRGIQNGIYWGTWYRLNDAETNARHSFKYVDMKVRPANFLQSVRYRGD